MMGFHHSARTESQNDLFQRKIGEALELKSTDKIRVPALLIINQQPLLKNVAIYRLIVNNNPGNSPVFIVTYFHHADRGETICNALVLHTPTFHLFSERNFIIILNDSTRLSLSSTGKEVEIIKQMHPLNAMLRTEGGWFEQASKIFPPNSALMYLIRY